ncbi:Peptidase S10 [Macleaya cordata]|uniref:Peptidase S10 n=1 Tax=Macleaya cordata TaxID=56857 RepID=A0A200Q636_MACCD|nr:Peptidase S10 [Macleaya cordata]
MTKNWYLIINKINQLFFCLIHLLLLLMIFVQPSELAAIRSNSSSSSRVVDYLPGLELPGGKGDGSGPDLPFHLETGYVGVGKSMDVQLFYYFVESERNPKEDPLLVWLTGGPRCSALSAFAFEIGQFYYL